MKFNGLTINYYFFSQLMKLVINKIISHIKKYIIKKKINYLKKLINDDDKVLFLDIGSNYGQSFKYFSKYFNPKKVNFILVEPNIYCNRSLNKIKNKFKGKISIINQAASNNNKTSLMHCYDNGFDNIKSVSASIVPWHNNLFYKTKLKNMKKIKVKSFKTSATLTKLEKEFQKIIIKIDAEGSEYDILDDIIKNKAYNKICAIFVEFHSNYTKKNLSLKLKSKEARYRLFFEKKKIFFYEWI